MQTLLRTFKRITIAGLCAGVAVGCGVSSRMEPYKQAEVILQEGDQVVILARKHHALREAEENFTDCLGDKLGNGRDAITVHPTREFEDMLYPWFEPSTAPLTPDQLPVLFDQPGVAQRIADSRVRYVIWLDGSTDRVASGGGISCAAGAGGAGCLGLAWWQTDAKYEATVWDLQEVASAGTINADVTGRSVMPAIVVPLPFIARTQSTACNGLADQLRAFFTEDSLGS